jgi:hypothetical protein
MRGLGLQRLKETIDDGRSGQACGFTAASSWVGFDTNHHLAILAAR